MSKTSLAYCTKAYYTWSSPYPKIHYHTLFKKAPQSPFYIEGSERLPIFRHECALGGCPRTHQNDSHF